MVRIGQRQASEIPAFVVSTNVTRFRGVPCTGNQHLRGDVAASANCTIVLVGETHLGLGFRQLLHVFVRGYG